jgi:hypothetical protein
MSQTVLMSIGVEARAGPQKCLSVHLASVSYFEAKEKKEKKLRIEQTIMQAVSFDFHVEFFLAVSRVFYISFVHTVYVRLFFVISQRRATRSLLREHGGEGSFFLRELRPRPCWISRE